MIDASMDDRVDETESFRASLASRVSLVARLSLRVDE
jgi:hypothetical protein